MRTRLWLVLAAAIPLSACGDFFEVTNPGPIEDEALNIPEAVGGLVTGMSADLSDALGDLAYATSIMADELSHSGSYTAEGLWYRGVINADQINDEWADSHRARWTSENGIRRMKEVLGANFDKTPLAARAYLFAGFANRLIGENMCQAVFDGGAAEDHKAHFARAEQHFTEAIRIATALSSADFRTAAHAGRAAVRAWQGKWGEAAQDAALVPTPFVFNAIFSDNSDYEKNDLVLESNTTLGRRELSVAGTLWERRDPKDPRTPWTIPLDRGGKPLKGQDGKSLFYQQMKYTSIGAEIPLAKGTEMRMLQAEDALRRGNVAGAFGFINDMRRHHGLPALTAPASIDEAWDVLQVERGAVVWLEARRFWDLRRWNAESGPANHDFLKNRDKCIPISQNERESNVNVRG